MIDKYGDIFSTPAYLLKLIPQLAIDDEVVAEGAACNAGYMQKYTITIHNGAGSNNDSDISNSIEAGGMYSIAMDYGNISGEELAVINVSSQTVTAIRTSVNSGKTVIIPEETITINQWSGEGYMVLDPDTFACGYMISGGKAGGSMTIEQMIGEYISCIVQGALFVLAWECGLLHLRR